MVKRSKRAACTLDSEPDESSHSESEDDDSLFAPIKSPSQNGARRSLRNLRNGRNGETRVVPTGRNGRNGRNGCNGRNGHKRQRSVESLLSDSGSDDDDDDTAPASIRGVRSAQHLTSSEESENDPPRRRQGYRRRRKRREPDDLDDDDGGEGQAVRRTRNNAKVVEAVWTPEKTVRITYNQGVKHACMNPVHGKAMASYTVLHLVRCTWKQNVKLMTAIPSTAKSKLYQYSHKICQSCMDKYGSHCFKCDPSDGDIVPKLDTVFGAVAITSVDDFTEAVRTWQNRRDEIEASYLVLHCTVVGPEARLLRRKFDLKRWTTVHVVYSDARDRMEPAGSGQNLEASPFQSVWKTVMAEKLHSQDRPLVAFFGNILLNHGVTFDDFRVTDMLLMYQPNIFTPLEGDAMRASTNTISLQLPTSSSFLEVSPSDCCLRDAVAHTHHEPSTMEDDGLFQHGNLAAKLFYRSARRHFGSKICAEFNHRAMLGEHLKLGEDGCKLPFRKLFAARGGEVQFRRVANSTHDVARRVDDTRSRVCSADNSGFELVCWMSLGAPTGGDFVIPGLMYKFETHSGSALVLRPCRYFHATLPSSNRDLKNEKFAASFVTTT